MKIALVTDLHFGARNDNQKVAKFQSDFYNDVFFPYIDNNDITTVINLGDTFDRRKFISYTSLKSAKQMFFDPLLIRGTTLHCIVGNHDITYKNTLEVNSINLLLDGYTNIIEHRNPTELIFDDLQILFVPWICKDNYDESWERIQNSKSQIVMGHLELNGFQMYKGMPNYEGWDAEEFKKYDHVMSGHYHHKSSSGNISYLGTAYELTWSDYEDQKGFHVYDTSTRELEFIPNPHRLFHKWFYDDTNLTYNDADSFDYDQLTDKYVKVVIKNKQNPVLFDLYINSIEQRDPINLQVVEDHLHLDLEDDSDIIDEAEDTLTILDSYIEGLEVKADKYELKKLMHQLYSEALNIE
jgi:hypothetical protein